MVMDIVFTPRIYPLPSSLFMTPPDSDEKRSYPVVHSAYQTPRPLPQLSLLLTPVTPATTPPRRSNKGKTPELTDVLSELIECGITRVADDILSFLSSSDLVRCMLVSHKWHEMVTSRENLMDKVTSYRKLCKTRSENVHKSFNKQPFSHQALLSRQPLSSISANIQPRASNPLPSFTPLPTKTMNHHRPCPQCQSPAKELNLRRAECTKCKLDFCLNCFDEWHEGDCPIRSPKRPARSTAIAGTLMCKKRLRRL
eukprot:Em0009g65a